ncbi:hypothetical protein WJM97_22680 [Okeanomitos corallinicola TIOX110]|uniref:Uncharacterized protein n=1 Tax=Okeanomitos corallinicola TIOX110 TaxID=3133117 RepID=A0ABZ2UT27_9CYAN
MPVSSHREVLPQPVIEQNSNISNPDNGDVLTPSFAETATKKEEPEISTPQLEMVSSREPEPQVLPEIPTNHPSQESEKYLILQVLCYTLCIVCNIARNELVRT